MLIEQQDARHRPARCHPRLRRTVTDRLGWKASQQGHRVRIGHGQRHGPPFDCGAAISVFGHSLGPGRYVSSSSFAGTLLAPDVHRFGDRCGRVPEVL